MLKTLEEIQNDIQNHSNILGLFILNMLSHTGWNYSKETLNDTKKCIQEFNLTDEIKNKILNAIDKRLELINEENKHE